VQVSSTIGVMHLIIKLHVRIAENYRLLNRTTKCIKTYEDAHTVGFYDCILCCSKF
jgi:hypothetical protein